MQEKFILIDGNSLMYRAYYALPLLTNSKGFVTNAIYGFCNMLLKVLEEEKPTHIAIAFDKGKIVFRHAEYEKYKATRKPMPEELKKQLPVIKELLNAMNIEIFEMEGYEADDLIGTLTKKADDRGLNTIILTGDRDALQLLSPSTKVSLTKKGISEMEIYTEESLYQKYGIKPLQMIDLKGLMGDVSDNIPGIPGVGEKTALKLIQEYQDIENVLAHYEDFTGKKLGMLLQEFAEQARISRSLAIIDRNVPLEIDLQMCRKKEPDHQELARILRELEFKGMLNNTIKKMGQDILERPSKEAGESPDDQSSSVLTVRNPQMLKENLKTKEAAGEIYFKLKKHSPNNLDIEEIVLHLQDPSIKETPIIYLNWESDAEKDAYLQNIKKWLESNKARKTLFDAKSSILGCRQQGIHLEGVENDLMLMSYLLNPSRPQNDLLDFISEHIDFRASSTEEIVQKSLMIKNFSMLAVKFRGQLMEKGMWALYKDLELPLCEVLADMETKGVRLDKKILEEIGAELDVRIKELTSKIYEMSGEKFNINSPKQLGEILFSKLGLTHGKKTKTGYSTNAEVLENLAKENEIVAEILMYRQLSKIKSTYIDGLGAMIDQKTDRIYTSFNQTVTATGRLSSTEPNLQNIPIRMEEGRRLRRAFVTEPGFCLLSADYSQIELRILAHLAQDQVLIEAFHHGQDIHSRTAAEVFGIPIESVSKEMRRAAKAVNFGIVYGISDYGLSQDLGISRAEAKEYIDSYFRRYQGVKKYIDGIIEEARERGYVTTILNRRRYLPEIKSRNYNLRSFAERMAMNTPIQGSAADIIKLAMLHMHKYLLEEKSKATMVLQVHDELIFEVPKKEVGKLALKVNAIMSEVYKLLVPLKVDIQFGPNWYDLEPVVVQKSLFE